MKHIRAAHESVVDGKRTQVGCQHLHVESHGEREGAMGRGARGHTACRAPAGHVLRLLCYDEICPFFPLLEQKLPVSISLLNSIPDSKLGEKRGHVTAGEQPASFSASG